MTQAYNLSQLANNLNSSGQLDATDGLVNAVPVANGGTGASTAAGAATNLVVEFGKILYPIGSIYTNATNATNPATLLGFGTWVAFAAGRVAVGFNASNPLFDTAEETGGSADAVTVAHTHTATGGAITGSFYAANRDGPGPSGAFSYSGATASSSLSGGGLTGDIKQYNFSGTPTVSVAAVGASGTDANYQPYITVYMWKRTA